MGKKRIINMNATTDFEDDDNIVVDSETAGTRKMAQSVLKEKLRDSTLSDIHNLTSAADFATGDTVVVDNATDGPRGMDKDVLLAKTAQNALGSIKNLPTSITAFRTGDVIPVDGPSGTAKMGKDDLLKETAENGRNPCSMGYVDTTSDAEIAFGNDRDVKDADANTMWAVKTASVIGLPTNTLSGGTLITLRGNTSGTSLVQSWVDISGDIYTRTSYAFGTYTSWEKIATKSALDTAIDYALDNDENILKAKGFVYTNETAEAAFGVSRDVGNAEPNTMWSLQYKVCVGLPDNLNGTLITLRGNTTGDSVTQIFTTTTNRLYMRCKYGGIPYTSWSLLALDSALQTAIANALSSKGFINTATDATNAFGASKDVANAGANTMYAINNSVVVGMPTGAGSGGLLFTLRGNTAGNSILQIYADTSGDVYTRVRYAGTLRNWMKIPSPTEVSTNFANSVHSVGYVNTATDAVNAFGAGKDVADATANTMYSLNNSVVVGLPEGAGSGGTLITFRGNTTGTSILQIYADISGDTYTRVRFAGTLKEWKKLAQNGDTFSHVIPQLLKIGALGGSYTTGASDWKDADGVYHSVDHAELSWIQIWGREHGVQAFNFSHGGYSTMNWLAGADGLAKAQTAGNECKAYFILFGGGNDIRDYDGLTNLGSIADVHVGSEDKNPATYFGNYSRIIADLKSIGGARTKIFAFPFAQIMNSNALRSTYNDATEAVCSLYDDVYFIDIEDDEVINGRAIHNQYFGGHFSAYGYKLIADRFEYLVDKFVAEHPADFDDIQWIGSDLPIVQP